MTNSKEMNDMACSTCGFIICNCALPETCTDCNCVECSCVLNEDDMQTRIEMGKCSSCGYTMCEGGCMQDNKFTRQEVKFMMDTANCGPESTSFKYAPSERVKQYLAKNWGIAEMSETKSEYAAGMVKYGMCKTIEQGEADYERCKAELVANPQFRTGYERTRHAADWLEGQVTAIGWTQEEMNGFFDAYCAHDELEVGNSKLRDYLDGK